MTIADSTFTCDLGELFRNQTSGDVVFDVRGVMLKAHKICLVAASTTFADLFNINSVCKGTETGELEQIEVKHRSESKSRTGSCSNKEDKQTLIDNDDLEDDVIDTNCHNTHNHHDSTAIQYPDHPAFEKIERHIDSCGYSSERSEVMLVTLNPVVTPSAFRYVLEYLYTGLAPESECCVLEDIKTAAEMLNLLSLLVIISNFESQETFLNEGLEKRHCMDLKDNLRYLAMNKCILNGKEKCILTVIWVLFYFNFTLLTFPIQYK